VRGARLVGVEWHTHELVLVFWGMRQGPFILEERAGMRGWDGHLGGRCRGVVPGAVAAGGTHNMSHSSRNVGPCWCGGVCGGGVVGEGERQREREEAEQVVVRTGRRWLRSVALRGTGVDCDHGRIAQNGKALALHIEMVAGGGMGVSPGTG